MVTGPSGSQSRQGSLMAPTVHRRHLERGQEDQRLPENTGYRGARVRGASRTELFTEPEGWLARPLRRAWRRRGCGRSGDSGNRTGGREKSLLPRADEPFPETAEPGRNGRAGSSPSPSRPPPNVVLFFPAQRWKLVPTPQTFRNGSAPWRRRGEQRWERGSAGSASGILPLPLLLVLF